MTIIPVVLRKNLDWLLKKDWFRFILVGTTAFGVHFVFSNLAFYTLKQLGQSLAMSNRVAYGFGAAFAITYAFFLNKAWTFQDRQKEMGRQGAVFFLGRGISFLISFYLNIFVVEIMSPAHRMHLADLGAVQWLLAKLGRAATENTDQQIDFIVSQGFNGFISFAINYTWAKFLVFRQPKVAGPLAAAHLESPASHPAATKVSKRAAKPGSKRKSPVVPKKRPSPPILKKVRDAKQNHLEKKRKFELITRRFSSRLLKNGSRFVSAEKIQHFCLCLCGYLPLGRIRHDSLRSTRSRKRAPRRESHR